MTTKNKLDRRSPRPRQPSAAANKPSLSRRYGSIGIQAVAAAARYTDRRKSPAHVPGHRDADRPALRGVRSLAATAIPIASGARPRATAAVAFSACRLSACHRPVTETRGAAFRSFPLAGSRRSGQDCRVQTGDGLARGASRRAPWFKAPARIILMLAAYVPNGPRSNAATSFRAKRCPTTRSGSISSIRRPARTSWSSACSASRCRRARRCRRSRSPAASTSRITPAT